MLDQILLFVIYHDVFIATFGTFLSFPAASYLAAGSASVSGLASSLPANVSAVAVSAVSAVTNVTSSAGLLPSPTTTTTTTTATTTIVSTVTDLMSTVTRKVPWSTETVYRETLTVRQQVVVPPSFLSDYFVPRPTAPLPTVTTTATPLVSLSLPDAPELASWVGFLLVGLIFLVLVFGLANGTIAEFRKEREQAAAIEASNRATLAELETKAEHLSIVEAKLRAQETAASEANTVEICEAGRQQTSDNEAPIRARMAGAPQESSPASGSTPGDDPRVTSLRGALNAADADIRSLRKDLKEALEANDNGRAINDGLEQQLQSTISDKDAEISALRDEVASLSASRPDTTTTTTTTTDVSAPASIPTTLSLSTPTPGPELLDALQAQVARLELGTEKDLEALKEREATIYALEKRNDFIMAEGHKEVASLRASLDAAAAAHSATIAAHSAATTTIASLQQELASLSPLRDEVAELRTQLNNTSSSAAVLANLRAENVDLSRRLGEVDAAQALKASETTRKSLAEIEVLRRERQNAIDSMVMASSNLASAQVRARSAEDEARVAEEKLQGARRERDEMAARVGRREASLAEWQAFCNERVVAFNALVDEQTGLREQWHKDRAEIAESQQKLEKAEQTALSLSATISVRTDEVEVLRAQVSALREQLARFGVEVPEAAGRAKRVHQGGAEEGSAMKRRVTRDEEEEE